MTFIFVGLGGAAGAILRYAISLIPYKGEFPVLTLITNFLGALLIGYVVGTAAKKGMSQNMMLFLKTGLCGGFTTFSTFSLEAYQLLQNHHYVYGVSYMILSVGLCIAGVAVGMLVGE
jgi:CrcB protein